MSCGRVLIPHIVTHDVEERNYNKIINLNWSIKLNYIGYPLSKVVIINLE